MRKNSVPRLLILAAGYNLVANFVHPVEPTFYKNLAMPDYMFGVAFASMSLMNFLLSPFWGRISDRHGPNRVLGISYIGYGIGQVLFFLAKSEMDLILARFFSGIFIGGITVGHILYIIENAPEADKGKLLASFATVGAIFSAFGYLIGGVIGDLSLNACFYTQIIGLWLLSFLHFLLLEDQHRDHVNERIMDLFRQANPFQSFRLPKETWTIVFVSFLLLCMSTSFASTCYDQCFNYFIKDQYGFPPSYNGYLKGFVGIITLIANSTICTFLLKRTDIRRSIIYVLCVCLSMMIGIILIDSVVPFIVLNVVFFGFNAVWKPLLQSMLNGFSRKSSGSVVGVYNSISSIGSISGSLVSGFVYARSPKASFLFAAVAFFLAILFSIVQRNTSKRSTL